MDLRFPNIYRWRFKGLAEKGLRGAWLEFGQGQNLYQWLWSLDTDRAHMDLIVKMAHYVELENKE